jgi:hypothetical protein
MEILSQQKFLFRLIHRGKSFDRRETKANERCFKKLLDLGEFADCQQLNFCKSNFVRCDGKAMKTTLNVVNALENSHNGVQNWWFYELWSFEVTANQSNHCSLAFNRSKGNEHFEVSSLKSRTFPKCQDYLRIPQWRP